MKIVEKRKLWFSISLIVIIIGLVCIPIRGFNYDIEFSGGTMMHINIGQDFDGAEIEAIVKEQTGDTSAQAQKVAGKNEVIIKTKELSTEEREALFKVFVEKYKLNAGTGKDGDLLNHSNFSPTVSNEMKTTALLAIAVSAIAMLIYISIRFKDFSFGVSAVVALIHDILIVLAVYTVFRVPINNSFIAAMLTIVGYSINDTIVLFDRVRENQKFMKRRDFSGLVNRSIKQTMSRSINTSLTTFVTITVLYIIGVPTIKEFAFPLMVGILSGTYSSIFIASPLWYLFKKKDEVKVA